ncbi:hypothetical protein WISP_118958 [Willisornis vidua]|uniref:Uncharacterized protein n=1 Tax=Willisornis vidua TaxID=1566151 RepID=A0ABQ9CT15_9PASS|nr:hypothetical protein WISP_118958 [Willisornis vidua]
MAADGPSMVQGYPMTLRVNHPLYNIAASCLGHMNLDQNNKTYFSQNKTEDPEPLQQQNLLEFVAVIKNRGKEKQRQDEKTIIFGILLNINDFSKVFKLLKAESEI